MDVLYGVQKLFKVKPAKLLFVPGLKLDNIIEKGTSMNFIHH